MLTLGVIGIVLAVALIVVAIGMQLDEREVVELADVVVELPDGGHGPGRVVDDLAGLARALDLDGRAERECLVQAPGRATGRGRAVSGVAQDHLVDGARRAVGHEDEVGRAAGPVGDHPRTGTDRGVLDGSTQPSSGRRFRHS